MTETTGSETTGSSEYRRLVTDCLKLVLVPPQPYHPPPSLEDGSGGVMNGQNYADWGHLGASHGTSLGPTTTPVTRHLCVDSFPTH